MRFSRSIIKTVGDNGKKNCHNGFGSIFKNQNQPSWELSTSMKRLMAKHSNVSLQ